MKSTMTLGWAAAVAAALLAAACGGEKAGPTPTAAPDTKTTANTSAPGPSATQAAPPVTAATTATATAAPSSSADEAPTPSGSAIAGAKTFDCGAKGQKMCPMQAWMKANMAAASSSGEGDKLATALTYVATHVPPGFAGWAAMAKDGAAKAKAGDIDGAKLSCKQCHDAYKEKYKATMRDRPY